MRTTFVNALISKAREDKNLVLLTGDLGSGALELFMVEFPDRFINCGIAEQNMISVAAGLAKAGKKVVIYSIGNFDTLRVLEFIRNLVCYNNADVKIVSVGAGLEYGPLGFTHHATEDIACMRALPNMAVFNPATKKECELAMNEMLNSNTPAYLRLNKKEVESEIGWSEEVNGKIKPHKIKLDFASKPIAKVASGKDYLIISTGKMLKEAMIARDVCKHAFGIDVAVVSVPQLKPIDLEELAKIIKKHSIVWTTEEHSIIGGLGDIVCECVARFNLGTLVRNVGIRDEIKSTVGTRDYLISNADGAYNIGAAALIDDIKKCKMAIKM